jgi:hypothetical protein
MAQATVTSSAPINTPRGRGGKARFGRTALLLLISAVIVVGVALSTAIHYWPFEEKPVLEDLQEISDSQVQVQAFRRTYFPHPGCVLDGVVFLHGANAAKPLIKIDRLTIQSTYLGILRHHVSVIDAERMIVSIPPFGTGQSFHAQRSTIAVGEIIANGAILEFASRDPHKPPLRFDIHEVSLRDVGGTGPLTYRVKVHTPEPPGEVAATGKFGIWNDSDPTETPLSGEYKFEKANLGVYGGIAGTLSSTGKFDGKLSHIDISGTTDAPDFQVRSGGHPVRLTSEFSAYVDATHGDTFLRRVDAHFRKTHVVAEGSIAASASGNGKTALLNLSSPGGRIDDILGLFVTEVRPPMSGAVTLRAKVEIPPGERAFLEKIKLRGNFGIGGGEFSHSSTQEGVNKLSAGALGEKDTSDPETVLTDLTGKVALDKGIAQFAELSFGVPGAAARLHGTYDLNNHKIDLHGQMQVRTKISNTSSGAKAFLLKVMDPFFKKRRKGEILPVKISGTYEKPSFGLDPMDKKAQVAPRSKERAGPQ